MTPESILQRATHLGISLSVRGDRILYAPKSQTPREFVVILQDHKAQLLEYLTRTVDESLASCTPDEQRPTHGTDVECDTSGRERGPLLAWAAQVAEQDVVLEKPVTYVEAPLRRITTKRVSRHALTYLRAIILAQTSMRTGGRGAFTQDWWRNQEGQAMRALQALREAVLSPAEPEREA